MADEISESYEQLPYRKLAHAVTHPGRLHSILTLAGGKPVDVSRARVLELGCAAGWNLIPLAAAYPDIELVGLDLGESQIADGRAVVDEIGLDNVDLRHANIMDIDESWGQFDYIICHGIWSWVPDFVREGILKVARERMSPRGAIQISFNVYPRWKIRGLMRDIMMFHVDLQDPKPPIETVREGREGLEFIAKYMTSGDFKTALTKEIEESGVKGNEAYVFHEYFEPINYACYFREFAAAAEAAGLRYVTDTILELGTNPTIPDAVKQFLARYSHIQQEQYLDFLFARAFRSALLVHADNDVGTRPDPARMKGAQVLLRAKPKGTIQLVESAPQQIRINNRDWTVRSPIARAAVRHLGFSFPEPLPFPELYRRAREMLAEYPDLKDSGEDTLVQQLASGYDEGVVEFFFEPPRVCATIGERPLASPFSRHQARAGPDAISQLHRRQSFDPLAQFVLSKLDGEHDLDALVTAALEACNRGDLEFAGGAPKPQTMAKWINLRLERLRDAAMLIA